MQTDKFTTYIQLFALFALSIVLFVQNIRVYSLQEKVATYQAQISQLEVQSVDLQERFTAAQKESQIKLAEAYKQTQSIISADVPKDCTGAMKWAIEQSKRFT